MDIPSRPSALAAVTGTGSFATQRMGRGSAYMRKAGVLRVRAPVRAIS